MKKRRVYLDYASSTPTDSAVLDMMKPYFYPKYGNCGAMHTFGQEAQAALDDAREKVSNFFGCDFKEIVFTGSATEANNLAIRGTVKNLLRAIPKFTPHIIASRIEHASVLETLNDLEKDGVEVTYLNVDKEGLINPDDVTKSIRDNTLLVSIMYVNNEIGTIQPIQQIGQAILDVRKALDGSPNKISKALDIILHKNEDHEENLQHKEPLLNGAPYFHTDAVQALNYLDCNVAGLGVDMLTFSGHKIYGPKGIGGLYVKSGVDIDPIITGGGQEMGFRAGTENVPYIVGLGMAVEIAGSMRESEAKRLIELRDYFIEEVLKRISAAELNGPKKDNRVSNNANFLFKGCRADKLIIALDEDGIAVSAGATCNIKTATSSETLMALGKTEEESQESIRFTLGRGTTKDELDYVLFHLEKIVNNILG